MHSVLLVLHILVAITLVSLVLIQHGKGADAGAAFGSGASATVFGARGSSSFLTRASAILAAVFFATSLSLAYFSVQAPERASVTQTQKPGIIVDENTDIPIEDIPIIPPLPEEEVKGFGYPGEEESARKGKSNETPADLPDRPDLPPKSTPTPAEQ